MSSTGTSKTPKERPDPAKVGTIRPSQVTHTFGPGAIVELPYMSVVIPGLDAGRMDPWQTKLERSSIIEEDRLLVEVRRDLGPQVTELRAPPWMESPTDHKVSKADWVGLWAMPFPRWMRCTSCYALSRVDDRSLFDAEVPLYRIDEAGWWHTRCPKRKGGKARALPVRFVVACRNGHLDDFPWAEWAHRKTGYVCPEDAGATRLKLLDSGYAQRSTSQKVRCDACGSEARMTRAFGRDSEQHLPLCPGGRPHLNDYDPNGCGIETRALLVGASNVWFSVRRSALSIPHEPRPVEVAIAENWADLETYEDLAELERTAEVIGHRPQGAWLTDDRYSLENLWNEFLEQRDGEEEPDPGSEALLGPEWTALTTPGGADHGEDFAVKDPGPPATTKFKDLVGGVHLATRLREVVAITGFTRLDAYEPADTSPTAVKRAKVASEKTTWAPAAQSRGEGFLVTLDEAVVQSWEQQLADRDDGRHVAMRQAQRAWRERRNLDPDVGMVSHRFVLLHTFSHLLINAVSLRSGYATASIRERLYCRGPGEGDFPMAGILLYTAASDSEGTLGGLVSIGQPDVLGALLEEAIDNAAICTSDPFCAAHKPNGSIHAGGDGPGDGTVHGAACHVCVFLPETSCNHANRYLDRAYAVPTLSDDDIAFFA